MSEDEFVSRVTARAAHTVEELLGVVSVTAKQFTPNQLEDIKYLARQSYIQGRIDALNDIRRDNVSNDRYVDGMVAGAKYTAQAIDMVQDALLNRGPRHG